MSIPAPLRQLDEHKALRSILEGTATHTGERFFEALVENLANVLHTYGAWVTEYQADRRRLRALAFWLGGEWVPDYEIDIDGTPCERGAASLLGMKPSTLSSRMKALDITRPR